MQMIELTGGNGEKITVNPQFIVKVHYDSFLKETKVDLADNGYVLVQESYGEIKEMLQNVSTEETTALLHIAARLACFVSCEGKEAVL